MIIWKFLKDFKLKSKILVKAFPKRAVLIAALSLCLMYLPMPSTSHQKYLLERTVYKKNGHFWKMCQTI